MINRSFCAWKTEDILKECGLPMSPWKAFWLRMRGENPQEAYKELEHRLTALLITIERLEKDLCYAKDTHTYELENTKKRQSDADKLYEAAAIIMDMRR